MANEILIEQLDQAVEAILANPDALLPSVTDEVAPLLRIAVALRDLPREGFKARLKSDLERSTSMATEAKLAEADKTKTVNPVREGFRTVTPYLVVANLHEEIDFIKKVFGATGEYETDRPAWLTIGDSAIMVSDTSFREPTAAFLYVYVDDADATYRVAMQAGARSIEVPLDTPYGDRRCMIEDNWGNTWQIATHR